MRRLFFGLDIPAEIKSRLLKVRAEVAGARWQSDEQLHLTLLFLGNLEEERVLAVREAARCVPLIAFELNIAGLGCFGGPRAPRNLWAGVQSQASIALLHSSIKRQMDQLGIATEDRVFHPHITLCRFKRPTGSVESLLEGGKEMDFGSFQVNQFVLFESEKDSGGSVYNRIECFPP
ncbi:RNA 2',3'-cyclic phosphodiesterase [Marinobacter salexigens]|uniref:RNA 2',3'-cyclic phosphodiesterase n=1 Tax=Marinobacter salexigens TaxID=1925763 RepID=UPI000C2897F2|nr:RNA 2',3'-cyclic phosphodiesterase [Marinobacter salexigens]